MPVTLPVATLALRPVLDGVCKAVGFQAAGLGSEAVVDFLTDRIADQSLRLTRALADASDRAWRTLDLALSADDTWDLLLAYLLTTADQRSLRDVVRTLLAADPELAGPARGECRSQWRSARAAGLLGGGPPPGPRELAEAVAAVARFRDPGAILEAEWQLLDGLAGGLRGRYPLAARLVALRPPGGEPLFALAARYHFRRVLERDDRLYRALTFGQLQAVHAAALEAAVGQRQVGEQLRELHAAVRELRDRTPTPVPVAVAPASSPTHAPASPAPVPPPIGREVPAGAWMAGLALVVVGILAALANFPALFAAHGDGFYWSAGREGAVTAAAVGGLRLILGLGWRLAAVGAAGLGLAGLWGAAAVFLGHHTAGPLTAALGVPAALAALAVLSDPGVRSSLR